MTKHGNLKFCPILIQQKASFATFIIALSHFSPVWLTRDVLQSIVPTWSSSITVCDPSASHRTESAIWVIQWGKLTRKANLTWHLRKQRRSWKLVTKRLFNLLYFCSSHSVSEVGDHVPSTQWHRPTAAVEIGTIGESHLARTLKSLSELWHEFGRFFKGCEWKYRRKHSLTAKTVISTVNIALLL